MAGSDSRPVLSVASAIFKPLPTAPSTLSAGTRTWWKRMSAFSIPRRPTNSFRRSTVTPGESASTMKAVIPPLLSALAGTRASTT